MYTKSVGWLMGLIALLLLGPAWVGGRDIERGRALPDEAFTAIVREARQSIDRALRKGDPRSTYLTLRAEALVLALVADNRLNKPGEEAAAAQLRDAALHLIDGLELHHTNQSWVVSHADLKTFDSRAIHAELTQRFAALEKSSERKPNGGARPVRYRLSSRFDHHDVTLFFGGCGGNSGHKIAGDLRRLNDAGKSAFVAAELPPLELLGYKVALVGELVRDCDGNSEFFHQVPNADRRRQWAVMTADLEQAAWQLADSARAQQSEAAREAVAKLHRTCTACHQKAGVP